MKDLIAEATSIMNIFKGFFNVSILSRNKKTKISIP